MLRKLWKILWISTLSFFGIGFAGCHPLCTYFAHRLNRLAIEYKPVYKPVDYTLTPAEQGLKVGDWIKVSGPCELDEDTGGLAEFALQVRPPPPEHSNKFCLC